MWSRRSVLVFCRAVSTSRLSVVSLPELSTPVMFPSSSCSTVLRHSMSRSSPDLVRIGVPTMGNILRPSSLWNLLFLRSSRGYADREGTSRPSPVPSNAFGGPSQEGRSPCRLIKRDLRQVLCPSGEQRDLGRCPG